MTPRTVHADLHPDMAAALAKVTALSQYSGDRTALPVARQRILMAQERAFWNAQPAAMHREWHALLPGPFREVPVHVMRPDAARGRSACIVYLHGGGWMLGSTATHESILRGLATASGCTVVGVDYALAPEYRFPLPVEETAWVLRYVHDHAVQWQIDPGAIAVAGDSSGANVALAAALQAQREHAGLVKAGIFYYGVFDADLESGSAALYGNGAHGLTTDRMRYYWDQYVPDPLQRGDGRVNLLHADLSAAFPMYLLAAGCDILRDGALRFARRLDAGGIPHRLRLFDGMGHAFMGYGRMLPAVSGVHAEAAQFLRAHMKAGTQ